MLLLAFVLCSFSGGDDNEFRIKAMFIYNFTKYVEWPADNGGPVFRIGVYGKSDILEPLRTIASQKKAGDRKIEITRLEPDKDVYCQIIFIPREQARYLESLEKKYSGKGVLFVTDESERPAAINLVTRDNKVRFEINQTMAKNGGVKISGQLLNLAVSVHP